MRLHQRAGRFVYWAVLLVLSLSCSLMLLSLGRALVENPGEVYGWIFLFFNLGMSGLVGLGWFRRRIGVVVVSGCLALFLTERLDELVGWEELWKEADLAALGDFVRVGLIVAFFCFFRSWLAGALSGPAALAGTATENGVTGAKEEA